MLDNKLINELVELQKELGRSLNTQIAMHNSYDRVAEYMDFDIDSLKSLTKKEAQEIIIKLSKKYSNSTIKLTRTYINELYKYAELDSPFKGCKLPTQKRNSSDGHHFFTIEEAKRILEVSKGNGKKNDLRNHALISLIINNGLRKSEAINLNIEDIDFDNCEITLNDTKKESKVVIEVADKTMELLKVYLDSRNDDLKPVFISSYKQRLSSSGIDSIIGKIYKKANVEGSPHDMRSTTASLMSEQGYDLIDIKTKLRHKSSVTTMGYISQSKDRQRKLANALAL